jgi:hypothetical protein
MGKAFVARMAGTVESILRLLDEPRQMDIAVLLRTLYEHMVLFAWISIDPDVRFDQWLDDARVEMRKLHNDALLFGETVLEPDELAQARAAKPLPGLPVLALEVDRYWSARHRGFRAHPEDGPREILTVSGMYAALYRVVSRSAHAQPQSFARIARLDVYPRIVGFEDDDSTFWSSIALAIFSLALLVSHDRFGWPDDAAVTAINDALTHDIADPRRDGA